MDNKKQEEKKDPKIYQKYANIFSGMEGQDVISDFIRWLGWYEPIVTEEDRVQHNVALELLNRCGGWQTKILGIHKK